jgi:hypothetical protein
MYLCEILSSHGGEYEDDKKSKAVPLHAMEALGGEEVYLLLIHDLGTRWG